jgi:RNA polymerase sigma-70 factor (ECF subfamily)
MPTDGEDLDDESLVERIQKGIAPEASFHVLFERYRSSVRKFFLSRGFSPEDAADLTQESFLRVYRGIGRFRHDAKFKSWLHHVVTNLWKNEVRRLRTGRRSGAAVPLATGPAGEEQEIEPPDPRTSGLLEHLLREEKVKLLYEAIGGLPPQMRRCVVFRIGQGLKYREIAELMQISVETVKAQIHQGRRRLQEALGDRIQLPEEL